MGKTSAKGRAPIAATPESREWWKLQAFAAERKAELMIYGIIGENYWTESVSASDLVRQLNALQVDEILVRLNSPGGGVADGVAIHNALRAHSARITVRIEGQAASIASLIACAGDELKAYANTTLMIHAPWACACGNARDFRNYADWLDTLAEAAATSYQRKSGQSREVVMSLLTDGEDHTYTAAQARDLGYVDEVIDDVNAPPVVAPVTASQRMQAFAALFPDLYQPANAGFVLPSFAAQRGINPEPSMDPVTTPALAVTPPASTATPPVDIAAVRNEAQASAKAAAKARMEGVRGMFALCANRAELASLEADCLADDGCDAAEAGKRILEAQAKATSASPTGGAPRAEMGTDERDNFRIGMASALLHRFNPSMHELDERGQRFKGMNLVRMAEEACRVNGIRGSHVPGELAAKALHSTSDFPFVLENVVTKTLRAAYEGTVRTFVPWTRRAVLPDFKQVSRVQLGGAPNLKRIVEGGEYEMGTIGEGAEKYAVQKYGRMVAITWETIINDDLGAFTRVPEMFGRSAADLESDIVYAILTANAALSDGVALFHATHGNLGTAGAISDTTLSEGREKMLLQKGIEGRYITVRPEFLIVPPRQLTLAQKSVALPIAPTKTFDANTFYQALDIIAEPRLQDSSATAYYLAAGPNAVDTIEYAYLEGYEGVFTETKQGFEVDGVMVKCRHVFGAKAIDYRGLFKNAGA